MRISRTLSVTVAAFVLLAPATAVRAVEVGDSYDQVIAEKGQPSGTIKGGAMVVLQYPDATIRVNDGVVVSVKAAAAKPAPEAAPRPSPPAAGVPAGDQKALIAGLKMEFAKTVKQVVDIVNQPVARLPQNPSMTVGSYPDGWFHPGAALPNFAKDDVAKTQDTSLYVGHGYDYATSPLNPGVVFPVGDLAFNSQTKIFYQDMTTPKKKLTDQELRQVNALYRILARDGQILRSLGVTPTQDGK